MKFTDLATTFAAAFLAGVMLAALAGCGVTATTAPTITPTPARPVPATQPAAAPAVDAAVTRLDAVDADIARIVAYATKLADQALSALASQTNADASTLRSQLADARGQVSAKDSEVAALRTNIQQTAVDRTADAKAAQGLLDAEHAARVKAEAAQAKAEADAVAARTSKLVWALTIMCIASLGLAAFGGWEIYSGNITGGISAVGIGLAGFAVLTATLHYLPDIEVVGLIIGCVGVAVAGVGIWLYARKHNAATDLAVAMNNIKTIAGSAIGSISASVADSTLGTAAAKLLAANAPTPAPPTVVQTTWTKTIIPPDQTLASKAGA